MECPTMACINSMAHVSCFQSWPFVKEHSLVVSESFRMNLEAPKILNLFSDGACTQATSNKGYSSVWVPLCSLVFIPFIINFYYYLYTMSC